MTSKALGNVFKLNSFYNVKDPAFGAKGDGVTDDSAAFAAARNAAGSTGCVVVPGHSGEVYLLGSALTWNDGASRARYLKGLGRPTLKFSGLGAADDCLTFGDPGGVRHCGIEDIVINCNSTGRDGLVFTMGETPHIINVEIDNSKRDALALSCSGFGYIEGLYARQLFVNLCGRHGIRMELAGANGAFINECVWEGVELRGCSVVTASGNFCRLTSTASGPASKFGHHLWLNPYLDCQGNGVAPDPSTHVFEIDSGNAEHWLLQMVSSENTGGGSLSGGSLLRASGSGGWGVPKVLGHTHSGWGNGGIDSATTNYVYFSDTNPGIILPGRWNFPLSLRADASVSQWIDDTTTGLKKWLAKTSAPASETDGLPVGMGMHSEISIAASSTGNLDFPLARLASLAQGRSHGFLLILNHSQFDGSGNVVQRGYHVLVRPDGSVVLYQAWDNSSAGMIASVAGSSVSTTTLRIAVTTDVNWGAAGGHTVLTGCLLGPLSLQ